MRGWGRIVLVVVACTPARPPSTTTADVPSKGPVLSPGEALKWHPPSAGDSVAASTEGTPPKQKKAGPPILRWVDVQEDMPGVEWHCVDRADKEWCYRNLDRCERTALRFNEKNPTTPPTTCSRRPGAWCYGWRYVKHHYESVDCFASEEQCTFVASVLRKAMDGQQLSDCTHFD